MKIYIASDHGGFNLKENLKTKLTGLGYEVSDLGNNVFDENDDYPDFIIPLAEKVASEEGSFGIVIGRGGNGEAIAANKVKGVRAALCLDIKMARLAREHNNANVLALGADNISQEMALKVATTFFESPFNGEERHVRRIGKLTSYETTKH